MSIIDYIVLLIIVFIFGYSILDLHSRLIKVEVRLTALCESYSRFLQEFKKAAAEVKRKQEEEA